MCSCVLGKRSSSFSSVIDVPPNVVVCNKRFLLFLVMVTNGHKVFKMCLTMNELTRKNTSQDNIYVTDGLGFLTNGTTSVPKSVLRYTVDKVKQLSET